MTFRAVAVSALFALVSLPAASQSHSDPIFRFDFEDVAAGLALPSCAPVAPEFPPVGYQLANDMALDVLWRSTTGLPIGSALAQVRIASATYQAHPFERAMFPDGDVHAFHGDTSNVGAAAIGASVRYVAISECLGDLRRASPGDVDPTLEPACRVYPSEGPFLYLNWGPARPGMCNLDPARLYVFNVIFDDPVDGYDASVPCNPELAASACGFRMSVLPGN